MFRYESFFGRLMTKVFDLMMLNMLFIMTSLPIVTIGSSLTALYASTLEMAQKNENSVYKIYFTAFKDNFKQATIFWLFLLGFLIILVNNLKIVLNSGIKMVGVIPLTYFFITLLLVCSVLIFPIINQFKNSYFVTLKNTFLILLGFLPQILLMVIVTFGPLFFATFLSSWFYGILIYFYLIIGCAGTCFINSFFLNRIFIKILHSKEELAASN